MIDCFEQWAWNWCGPLRIARRLRDRFGFTPDPAVVFLAPVRLDGAMFDLLPRQSKPRKSDWRWLLAARFGVVDRAGADQAEADVRAVTSFSSPIDDVIACSSDLQTVKGRLTGATAVLGYPPAGEMADSPVRVHGTPLRWLRAGCSSVVPVGDEMDVQWHLRSRAAGVIADSVPHGEALLRKMRRELPARPKVLLAA